MLEVALVLTVAAIAWWVYFAAELGPKLWRSQPRAFWLCVGIAGSVYLRLLVGLPDKGWGLSDMFAFLGLYVGLIAAILAVRSIWATEDSARQAAASARELVENELHATLDIQSDPHGYREPGDGLHVGNAGDNAVYGPGVQISGYLRNIGRYPARDVQLAAFHGSTPGRTMNPPRSPLFPHDRPQKSPSRRWFRAKRGLPLNRSLTPQSRFAWYSRSRTATSTRRHMRRAFGSISNRKPASTAK
jgi:hypothetical protein